MFALYKDQKPFMIEDKRVKGSLWGYVGDLIKAGFISIKIVHNANLIS